MMKAGQCATRNFRLWRKLTFHGYDVNMFLAYLVSVIYTWAWLAADPKRKLIIQKYEMALVQDNKAGRSRLQYRTHTRPLQWL